MCCQSSRSDYLLRVSESPGQLYFLFFCPTSGDNLLVPQWYRDVYTFIGVPDGHLLLKIAVLVTIHRNYLKCLLRIQILGPYSSARESESLWECAFKQET